MSLILSRPNKSVLLPTITAAVNLFPAARRLDVRGAPHLLVPHNLQTLTLLKHLGMKVPNPMLSYYHWCGGTPFDVQRQTCAMLSENPRAYVLNHMGTGKTKSALWAWDYLYSEGLAGKALVVAPLSTLHFVWAREVFATLRDRKVAVLHGTKKQRLDRLNSDADIFVINHDGVKVVKEELEKHPDIDTLILDELAVYRNNSDRSKVMRAMADKFNIVWGLTGAPMPNAPTDVWSQCKIVTPHTVPKFFKHAEEMLMTRISTYKMVPKPDAVDKAFRMMQPSVRYALDDVVELPDIVSRTIDVDLSPQQKKLYDKMAKHLSLMVADKQITAVNAGVAMSKLVQIAAGWIYTTAPEHAELDATPRLTALLDIINSNDRKLLVFVPYRHALAGISKVLDKEKIEHFVVHGDVKDRDQIFNVFQNTDKGKVLLAHPECLAHGLTLTVADSIVWYSPITSLDIYDQANARIRRVGQQHRQQILHLQAAPVEGKIYSLLRSKQKVQDQLLAMFEDATVRREEQ